MLHATTFVIVTLMALATVLRLTSSFSLTSRHTTTAFAIRNTSQHSAATILFPSHPLKAPNLRHVFVRNLALVLTAKLEASLLSAVPATVHVQEQQPPIQCIQDNPDIGAEITGRTNVEGTATATPLLLLASFEDPDNNSSLSIATFKSNSLSSTWNYLERLGAPHFSKDDLSQVESADVSTMVKVVQSNSVKDTAVIKTELESANTDKPLTTTTDTTGTFSRDSVLTNATELDEIHHSISDIATHSLMVAPATKPVKPQMSPDIAPPAATETVATPLHENPHFRSTKPEQVVLPTDREARVLEARIQPKAPEVEAALKQKYAAITSIEERAFTILFDLGMIDITGEEEEEEE